MGSCDFIAGWTGGVLGLVTGHPFDTIKVNQQNMGIGFWNCTKQILKSQGLTGYFRGMAFPIVAASTINSIYFGVYRISLERMLELRQENTLLQFNPQQQLKVIIGEDGEVYRSYVKTFVAGCIGGTAQLILTVPVELVKIKLQTSGRYDSIKYRGPLDVMRSIVKTIGISGLYGGFGITAIRDIPSSGVYMCGYAVLSDSLQRIHSLQDSKTGTPNAGRVLIAGGLAGIVSWWSIIPFDVVKSRIQADNPTRPKYSGWIDCSRHIFRQHGFRGFTHGVFPLTLRAFPVNAVTFLGYEWTNTFCLALGSSDKF